MSLNAIHRIEKFQLGIKDTNQIRKHEQKLNSAARKKNNRFLFDYLVSPLLKVWLYLCTRKHFTWRNISSFHSLPSSFFFFLLRVERDVCKSLDFPFFFFFCAIILWYHSSSTVKTGNSGCHFLATTIMCYWRYFMNFFYFHLFQWFSSVIVVVWHISMSFVGHA